MKKILLILLLSISNNLFSKELTIVHDRTPRTFDPYEESTLNSLRVTNMLFDPLIRKHNGKDFEPRLALKWKTIDSKTTRFYLRRNIYFHSGYKFSSKDIIYTFKRIKDSPDFKQLFSKIDQIKIVDDFTVDFISERSFPLILNIAAIFFPMDSQFYSLGDGLKKENSNFSSTNASGTGSFELAETSEDSINFVANNRYWGNKNQSVENISLKALLDESSRVNALLSGNASIVSHVSNKSIAKIKLDKRFKVENFPGYELLTILINSKEHGPLRELKIRQALNHAIDRDKIVKEAMLGGATPAEQFSPPIYKGHNKHLLARFDPEKARSLLKQAENAGDKTTLVFELVAQDSIDKKILELISIMLKDVGITIKLRVLSGDNFWNVVDSGEADLMLLNSFSDTSDSNYIFEYFAACPDNVEGMGKFNSGGYCNPVVDSLIQEAGVVTDLVMRTNILRNIEKMLYDDAMHIPLFWENIVWASKSEINLSEMLGGTNLLHLDKLSVDEPN